MTTNTTPSHISTVLSNINLDDVDKKLPPRFEACEVGPFRLPGIKVNTEVVTPEDLAEMRAWAEENGAYVNGESLFSWKKEQKRDWFTLRWS